MTASTFTRRGLDTELSPQRPGAGTHDWEFLIDGRAAGRCYMKPIGLLWVWHWTLYDTNAAGQTKIIEQAQEAFKTAFEKHREYLTEIWRRRGGAV